MDRLTMMKEDRDILREYIDNLIKLCEDSVNPRISEFVVKDKADRLLKLEETIKYELLESEEAITKEELQKELRVTEEYREKYTTILARLSENKNDAPPSKSNKKKIKLPEIQLNKFDGEVKNWLTFWGQFRKIADDRDLEEDDKYLYLKQCTTGKARNLVESCPMASNTFSKVLSLLKERFAKDEMLVEHHVRVLINIMLEQVSTTKRKNLCDLYDAISQQLNALEMLNMTKDSYAAMLLPMLESSIPTNILLEWERCKNKGANCPDVKINNLDNFMNFLRCEVESEERVKFAQNSVSKLNSLDLAHDVSPSAKRDPTASTLVNNNDKPPKQYLDRPICIFCGKFHVSQECVRGIYLSLKEKRDILSKNKCCFSCFKKFHTAKLCRAPPKCIFCRRNHFTIMCPDSPHHKKSDENIKQKIRNNKPESNMASKVTCSHNNCNIYMQTLMINILNPRDPNKSLKTRVLLDTGSTRSYVLTKIAKKLMLPSEGQCRMRHGLFGGVTTHLKHVKHRAILSNLERDIEVESILFTQDVISNFVDVLDDENLIAKLKENNIILSDKYDNNDSSNEIGVLLGADIIGKILTGKIVKFDGISCIDTQLGWTILGEGDPIETGLNLKNISSIPNLWELEIIGISDPVRTLQKKERDNQVLTEFLNTVQVNDEGRYEVRLPWVREKILLRDNKSIAEKRLISTTNKLIKLKKWEDYNKEFNFWLENKIIEKVPSDEIEKNCEIHYLPHRPVFKQNSTTTKIRPVFDASCKDLEGVSLNSCLETGPNLLELIPDLLIKFRLGEIGVISDIAKAFLQISVNKNDRDMLRFLWWKDATCQSVEVFRHTRVVFGLSPSPFLLMATIYYHLMGIKRNFEDTANKLAKSFYVDNSISAVNNQRELKKFMTEAQTLMLKGKFDLREWGHTKWKNIELDCCKENKCIMNRVNGNILSVLGIKWDTLNDTLFCEMKFLKSKKYDGRPTRRTVLSLVQSIFDPLGILGPIMVTPKLILQESWVIKLNWDEVLPEKLYTKFVSWKKELVELGDLEIPRCLISAMEDVKFSLHTYCDASKVAYGACVYLRKEYGDQVQVSFIQSKSRISPIKEKATIPRLELLACLIGVRLSKTILESLKDRISVYEKYYWTDSMVCIGWLSQNRNWTIFVKNRVKEILENTNSTEWFHLPGGENPADRLSRGCPAKMLVDSDWFTGPEWLRKGKSSWPIGKVSDEGVNTELLMVDSVMTRNNITDMGLFNKYSSFFKTIKIIGWIFRFYYLLKNRLKSDKLKEILYLKLTAEEIERAEKKLLEYVQKVSLKEDSLKNMITFVDKNNLIRIKSRLEKGNFGVDFTSPIVLPNTDKNVINLLREIHLKNCHAGVQTMLAIVRDRFWVLKSRRVIKKVVRQCIVCRRYASKHMQAPEPPLPIERIARKGVFESCGVDLGGPLTLKCGRSAWFVLFTCSVFRAVHLELVECLSTEAFIRALRRFIARRGRIMTIFCDNATNFKGTDKALNEIEWEKVELFSIIERIKFKFNVPAAPWWGGFYERLIRVIKDLLRKVLGRTKVNYEELYTVLCDVEAVVNNRPLTYIAEDDGLKALTPADFLLTSKYGSETADLDIVDERGLKEKAKYLQMLREQLRYRFKKEYLGLLIFRENKKAQSCVKIGEVVLVEMENVKRILWPIGRVVEVKQGSDGIVRMVKVKTEKNELWRPIQRIFPLEVREAGIKRNEDTEEQEEKTEERNKDNQGQMKENDNRSEDKNEIGNINKVRPFETRSGRISKPPQRFQFD